MIGYTNKDREPDVALPLFSSPPTHAGARSAESDAAARVAPGVGTLRRRVLDDIEAAGERGLTSREAGAIEAARRGLPANDVRTVYSVAPRIPEPARAGHVRTTGRRDGCEVWVRA